MSWKELLPGKWKHSAPLLEQHCREITEGKKASAHLMHLICIGRGRVCVNIKRKEEESSTRLGIRRKESERQRGEGNGRR